MPKLKKVIAGLALGTALAGGALATSATAASATTATGWGGAGSCNNRSDLDDVLWDICVAGNGCNACPEWDGCFN
ncbi:hypothetical protein [Microbispora sp. NPDC049125]|uniref:hypothetical protein n=1 Tax=Microbispora sp. NPDC049125 TaxID=3154929 RepID=UPI003466337F